MTFVLTFTKDSLQNYKITCSFQVLSGKVWGWVWNSGGNLFIQERHIDQEESVHIIHNRVCCLLFAAQPVFDKREALAVCESCVTHSMSFAASLKGKRSGDEVIELR